MYYAQYVPAHGFMMVMALLCSLHRLHVPVIDVTKEGMLQVLACRLRYRVSSL